MVPPHPQKKKEVAIKEYMNIFLCVKNFIVHNLGVPYKPGIMDLKKDYARSISHGTQPRRLVVSNVL